VKREFGNRESAIRDAAKAKSELKVIFLLHNPIINSINFFLVNWSTC